MTAAASVRDAAGSTRPAIDDPRLAFVEDARRFAAAHRSRPAFRFLRAFTRAGPDELDQLMAKIWCDARPERPGRTEGLAESCLKQLLQPFHFLVSKSVFWRAEERVDFAVEAIDEAHFAFWLKRICAGLRGSRRLSPSHAPFASAEKTSAPIVSSVTPRSILLLLAAPLFVPGLLALSRRHGLNLLASYRRALSLFAVFDGHFRRHPCRHFVTSSDELNHPARWLAFKRACSGRLIVVQNGERLYHPAFAFGATDDYLVYGPFMAGLCRDLGIRADRVVPVGAVNFDARWPLLNELAQAPREPLYDVLVIDQGWGPDSDLGPAIIASFEKVLHNLDRLKSARPGLRTAFQLRPYPKDSPMREGARAGALAASPGGIEILENHGLGESYRGIARARLVICFNSTIGYETFFVGRGRRTLFVNCAGDPCQILCLDPRFQLYDPAAGYEAFVKAVDRALAVELPAPPQAALERRLPPDGLAVERAIEALASL